MPRPSVVKEQVPVTTRVGRDAPSATLSVDCEIVPDAFLTSAFNSSHAAHCLASQRDWSWLRYARSDSPPSSDKARTCAAGRTKRQRIKRERCSDSSPKANRERAGVAISRVLPCVRHRRNSSTTRSVPVFLRSLIHPEDADAWRVRAAPASAMECAPRGGPSRPRPLRNSPP